MYICVLRCSVRYRRDLIHAGSDFSDENIRLHCYLDLLFVDRKKNRTVITNNIV